MTPTESGLIRLADVDYLAWANDASGGEEFVEEGEKIVESVGAGADDNETKAEFD